MKPSRVDALILLSAPSAATEGAFFLTECSTLLFFDTHGIHCKATMTPPIDSTAIYDKSLYEAEESGNKFETELASAQCKAKTEPDVFRFGCSLVDGV